MTLIELCRGVWVDPARVSAIVVESGGDIQLVVDGKTMFPDISISGLKDKLRPYISLEAL